MTAYRPPLSSVVYGTTDAISTSTAPSLPWKSKTDCNSVKPSAKPNRSHFQSIGFHSAIRALLSHSTPPKENISFFFLQNVQARPLDDGWISESFYPADAFVARDSIKLKYVTSSPSVCIRMKLSVLRALVYVYAKLHPRFLNAKHAGAGRRKMM